MKLTREEVYLLMRSMLRSIEKTPAKEEAAHKKLYDKLSAESVKLMPRKEVQAIARALDHATGEWGR